MTKKKNTFTEKNELPKKQSQRRFLMSENPQFKKWLEQVKGMIEPVTTERSQVNFGVAKFHL